MSDVVTSATTVELDRDALAELLVGATVTGVVVDDAVDTLRVSRADGTRWELAVHAVDVVQYGTVADLDWEDGDLRLVADDGTDLVAIVDQPTPAVSWDLARWQGRRSELGEASGDDAAAIRGVVEAPEVVVRLGVSRGDDLSTSTVAVRHGVGAWVDEDEEGDDLDVVLFDAADLLARVLEVGGLLDPYNLAATVDLLVTAPKGDGRTRVTVLEWTGEDGRLTVPGPDGEPVDADPAALIAEISEALAPYCGSGGAGS